MRRPAKSIHLKPGADQASPPGFLRRIAATVYDGLLLLAVLFLATALALPFNGGEAFTASQFIYPAYLLAVGFAFYTWFWTHGGQTLGLRAWKLKVRTMDGSPITWRHATTRFLTGLLSWTCLGLGFFWCLIDKNRLCWHDYLSKTHLVFEEEKR